MIVEGILGLVGGLLPKGIELFTKKSDQKHELKLLELQSKIGDKETEREIAVSEIDAFKESYSLDTGIKDSSRWVKDVNSLIRPVLTGYLIFALSLIVFLNSDYDLVKSTVETLQSMAVMALAWWFGNRGIDKIKK